MITILLYPISLLPLQVLYWLSDASAFVLYHIFKYRRKVVTENIKNAFPNLTVKERSIIEKDFYTSFCDNFIETLKLLTISSKALKSHIVADYSEIEKVLAENNNCHIYLGHQFNSEWANAHLALSLKEANVIVVHKPLSSKSVNNLMIKIRSRFGSKLVASKSMKKELARFSKNKNVLILAADQNPSAPYKSFWTSFLSQKTAFMTGNELYTANHKTQSLFVSIIREKRGQYKIVVKPLFDFSQSHTIGTITNLFTKKLEASIIENPANYLWCQERWKYNFKEEYKKRWINNR
jgi:KDO2-lipid IV(A) lauroyltransferase